MHKRSSFCSTSDNDLLCIKEDILYSQNQFDIVRRKKIEKVPTRSLVDSVDVLKHIHQLYPNVNEHQIDQSMLFHHHAMVFYKHNSQMYNSILNDLSYNVDSAAVAMAGSK